jgi:hypothetical protein
VLSACVACVVFPAGNDVCADVEYMSFNGQVGMSSGLDGRQLLTRVSPYLSLVGSTGTVLRSIRTPSSTWRRASATACA